MVDPAEADTVLFIFHHFMNGDSLGKISDALARKGIVSPTGRATWSRETISKLIANEKYAGDVILGKTNVIDGVQRISASTMCGADFCKRCLCYALFCDSIIFH